MGKGPIPDRWLDYRPLGRQIEGTRFIAFKVPLSKDVCRTIDDVGSRLDIEKILSTFPNLGLVIDLTNTYRYYDATQFSRYGVQYAKLKVPGHVIPPQALRVEFRHIVRSFLKKNKHNDKLIGVHCTHGVNRTGFFICDHMITELTMDPRDAVKRFEVARGHPIERQNYLAVLYNKGDESPRGMVRGKHDTSRRSKDKAEVCDNWRKKSSEVPARRSSQINESSRPYRRSPHHEIGGFPVHRPSRNEESANNARNPFRREPHWPAPAIPESVIDDKRHFRRNSPPRYSDNARGSFQTHSRFNDEKVTNDRNRFKRDVPSFASTAERGHVQHPTSERNNVHYRFPPRQNSDHREQFTDSRKIQNRPTSSRGDTNYAHPPIRSFVEGKSEPFKKKSRFSNDDRNERHTDKDYERSINRENPRATHDNWRNDRSEYRNNDGFRRDSKYSWKSSDKNGNQRPNRRDSKTSNDSGRNFRGARP